MSISWFLSITAEGVTCASTGTVSGFLFMNLSGLGFLVTHCLLPCRQPSQMLGPCLSISSVCMCWIVIANANACMSQCLSGICTLRKRNSFPTSLQRSNLTGLVSLVLNTSNSLTKYWRWTLDLSNMVPKKAREVTVKASFIYSSR